MGQVWRDTFLNGSKSLNRKTNGMVHFGGLGKEMETWSLGQEKALPTVKERRNHCFIQHGDVKCMWTALLSKGNLSFIPDWEMCVTVRLSRDSVSSHCCVAGGTCPIAMSFTDALSLRSLAFFQGLWDLGVSCEWWLCLIYTACKYLIIWIGAGNPIAEQQTVCTAKCINRDIFCSCKGSKPISPCWEIIPCRPVSSFF